MDVYLVDGTYELFRHYYAIPSARDEDGREVAAVRGVLSSVLGMIRGGATHIAVATDHVIESFRNELWADYKTSEGVEPDLLAQFPVLESVLSAAGIVVWPMVEFASSAGRAKQARPRRRDFRTRAKQLSLSNVVSSAIQPSTRRSVVREQTSSTITALGHRVLRYGLALVIAWIGGMKFTAYEAQGIAPLVAKSPFLGWTYHVLTVRQFSSGLGIVEISIAVLIALRHWSRQACAIGSAAASLMFLTTLSFLFSTPGWEPSLGGFPSLSGGVGQFLLKDLVLLGAAIWSLGESLSEH